MKENSEFIIIPKEGLDKLGRMRKDRNCLCIRLEDIFETEFLEYLQQVLNANRHIPAFSYPYIQAEVIGKNELCEIVERQYLHLTSGRISVIT